MGGGGWLRKGQPAIAESPRPTETPLAKAQQQDVETPATVEVDKTRKSMTPLRSPPEAGVETERRHGRILGQVSGAPRKHHTNADRRLAGVDDAAAAGGPVRRVCFVCSFLPWTKARSRAFLT